MFAQCDHSTLCVRAMAGFWGENQLDAPYTFTFGEHGLPRDNICPPTNLGLFSYDYTMQFINSDCNQAFSFVSKRIQSHTTYIVNLNESARQIA